MSVFTVNWTIVPEGLWNMLLVFGVILKTERRVPSATQLRSSEVIDVDMKQVKIVQASRRISLGLRHPGEPKPGKNSKMLRKLPAGSTVMIYRTKYEAWEGPHVFISVADEKPSSKRQEEEGYSDTHV